jgi:hypothetical protein
MITLTNSERVKRNSENKKYDKYCDFGLQATVTEETKGFYKASFVVKHTGVYEVMVTGGRQGNQRSTVQM